MQACQNYEICKFRRRNSGFDHGRKQAVSGTVIHFLPTVGKFAPNWIISVGSTCCGYGGDIVKGIFWIDPANSVWHGARYHWLGGEECTVGRNIVVTATCYEWAAGAGCRCWFIHGTGGKLSTPQTGRHRTTNTTVEPPGYCSFSMMTTCVPGILGSLGNFCLLTI